MGRKKIPVFSIVATDSRSPRDGRYIEDVGRYYPLEQPAEVRIDEDRVLYWLGNGAQPSDTVRSLLRKRGILLRYAMQQRGASAEEIDAAVEEHLERMAEKGDEVKMTKELRKQKALEAERERVRKLEEERKQREAEAKAKAEEEAKAKAEAEAKAKAEAEAAEAEASEEEAEADEADDASEDAAAGDEASTDES
jgi:small subunit ribosomal protein S16